MSEDIRNDPKTEVAPLINTYLGNGETFKQLQEIQDNSESNNYYNYILKCKIGRAHVWTPVTGESRMPSSAWKKKLY